MLTREQLKIVHDAQNNGVTVKSIDNVASILGIPLDKFIEEHLDNNGKLILPESIKPTLAVVHWRQLLLNPYKYSIKLAMLMKDGYNVEITTGVKGEKKGKENAKLRSVTFDEDYVIEKIIKDVIDPLEGMPDDLQVELFKKAQKRKSDRMPEISKHSLMHQEKVELWEKIRTQCNDDE